MSNHENQPRSLSRDGDAGWIPGIQSWCRSRCASWPVRMALLWLMALTSVYLLFGHGVVHPVDARSGEPLTWMHLERPGWSSAIAPLVAPFDLLADAPDFRVMIESSLFWGIVFAAAVTGWRTRRLRKVGIAVISVVGFALLLSAFMATKSMPSWRLVVDKAGMVVADLHSHTYRSHDGFASPEENLSVHRDHGFDVVGITDHGRPDGGVAAWRFRKAKRPDLPAVLPGIEIHGAHGALLLGIGLRDGVPLDLSLTNDDQTRKWIREVHVNHQGAVIALYLNRSPSDIAWLTGLGVDGFEIANRGHPELQPAMRSALRLANDTDLPLVASSDFHGWGTLMDTWTVVRRKYNGISPEVAVLSALREHRAADIIPVSAHPMGTISFGEAIVTPFVTVFQYGRNLSLPSLISWWIWAAIITLISSWLRRNSWRPDRVLLATVELIMGGSLIAHGTTLLSRWWQGITFGPFVGKIGAMSCLLGGAAGVAAWFALSRARYETSVETAQEAQGNLVPEDLGASAD